MTSSKEILSAIPQLSIITPVYNGSKFLEELIHSVKNQKNIKIEHIVIDDGSNDNGATVRILKKYPHIHWWSQKNKGQYATLNEGLKSARGKWICIISADDLLVSSEALKMLVDEAESNDRCDVAYGETILINEMGKSLPSYGRLTEASALWINKYFLLIHHCSLIVKNDFIKSNNLYFDTSLKYTGDWDWIIRMIDKAKIKFVNLKISKYRVHENQTRQTTTKKILGLEDLIVLKRYGSSPKIRVLIILYYRIIKIYNLCISTGIKNTYHLLLKKYYSN